MKMNLKLHTRILLGYLVPCVVFTIAVLSVYWRTIDLQETMRNTERAVTIVEKSAELQLYVAELQRAARGSLLKPQDDHLDDYESSKRQADESLVELKKLVRDPAQIARLNQLGETANEIASTTRRQMDKVRSGQVNEGIKDFQSGNSEALYSNFDKLSEQFSRTEKDIENRYRTSVLEGVAAVIRISAIGLLLAIAISVAASYVLARNTSHSLKAVISAIAASSTQIAATTAQHEGAMTQQASAVTETTATVEEVVATARVNAEQAESATQSATEVRSTTQEGLQLVTSNERDMGLMQETMNRVAQQIIGLSDQAGQIGEIARVVGELAAETNMLALNAAVEAARAGDQGKGFAVVASEIRKLADQSKKSAERANQIVLDIQKATNGMVMTAEEGSKTTHAAAQSARKASDAFEKVTQLADAVYKNAQQVLLNSRQQAVALSQIDIAMKNINNGAREISSGTVQMRAGMAKLSGVAGDLNRLL